MVGIAQIVSRADYYGKTPLVQPGSREWITSIECIDFTGWTLSPYIIFKGRVHIESWYQDLELPSSSRRKLGLINGLLMR